MTEHARIQSKGAAIRIENLDTDQIVPKQFLTGIDKAGLANALLYDLRFDEQGSAKPDFVLNRPEYGQAQVLIGGANFGCGSSREHAVWALQQFGVRAVIAPSFGEIFYSNAMNNQLLLVMLPRDGIAQLMSEVDTAPSAVIDIDIERMTVTSPRGQWPFRLSVRHREMFLKNLDVIGLTLERSADIHRFAMSHFALNPWLVEIASRNRARLP
jgi:3-isopropylmalate/(R)-2-methylmalate dehydratase small subunit